MKRLLRIFLSAIVGLVGSTLYFTWFITTHYEEAAQTLHPVRFLDLEIFRVVNQQPVPHDQHMMVIGIGVSISVAFMLEVFVFLRQRAANPLKNRPHPM